MNAALAALPSGWILLAGFLSILVGAFVQGSVGFGMGIVAMPILAMAMPQHLPQSLVTAAIPLSAAVIAKERRSVVLGEAGWMVLGRLGGIPIGIAILAAASQRTLQVIVGVATLAAAVLVGGRPGSPATTIAARIGGGTVSGIFGTVAGLGGPPLAMLYADREGPTLRATIAVVLLVGNIVMLPAYHVAGRLSGTDLLLGLLFLVPVLTGLRLGIAIRPHLHGATMRRAVLAAVVLAALVLLLRAGVG